MLCTVLNDPEFPYRGFGIASIKDSITIIR